MTTNAQIAAWLTRVEFKLDQVLGILKPIPIPAPVPTPAPTPVPAPVPAPVPLPPIQPPASGPLTIGPNYTRSRSGALPTVIRDPLELVAAGLVLPFDGANALRPEIYHIYNYKPFAWAEVGLTPDMGATGERQEIGLVTDQIANWLAGGSPANMLAQAEAAGSMPIHALIDGRVIDVLKYPRASFDPREGANPYFDTTGASVEVEQAHFPSLSYVPYLATGDIYYLEELQFAGAYLIAGGPNSYTQGKGIIYPWQTRAVAWGLRTLFQCYIATPEGELTAPLLPKSYWKQILDNNLEWFKGQYLSAPLAENIGFCATVPADNTGDIAVYQQDYLCQVIGWAVYTGKVPEWRPVYDVLAKQLVIRGTGPLRSQACQYWLWAKDTSGWPALLAANGIAATADGHYPTEIKIGSPHYAGSFRAACKIAVLNDVTGADAAFAYADAEARQVGLISLRHAV